MAGNTSSPGAGVVERVLAILECFDLSRTELTLTEIARQADRRCRPPGGCSANS